MSPTAPRKAYPTDLSDEQWAIIGPLMPPQNEGGREPRGRPPGSHQRRPLPVPDRMFMGDAAARPAAQVHGLRILQSVAIQRSVAANSRQSSSPRSSSICVRRQVGRNDQATAGIIDSQSVKTTETPDRNGDRGYNAGKKVNGRKRHILVDTLGLLIVVVVTAASFQDRDGTKRVFDVALSQPETTEHLQTVWSDGGYRGQLVDWTSERCDWELEIVPRPSDQVGFQVLPKCWIVERTFGWLGRYRLLSKDYEASFESSTTDIHNAMSQLMLRRLTQPPKATPENEHRLSQTA